MNLDQMLIDKQLGPFDIDDQQIIGKELLINHLEDSIETFLQFYGEDELMEQIRAKQMAAAQSPNTKFSKLKAMMGK